MTEIIMERKKKIKGLTHQHPPRRARHVITFTFKTAVEGLMYGLLSGLDRVLIPCLSIVTAKDHDLSLLAPQ